MQRLRIIALLHASILYEAYGQIHVPTNLPNYVHMLVMNSSFLPPLNHRNLVINLSIWFYFKQRSSFIYY